MGCWYFFRAGELSIKTLNVSGVFLDFFADSAD